MTRIKRQIERIRWNCKNPTQAWYRSHICKWYWRAKYGYGPTDTWNLDAYLAKILAKASPAFAHTSDEAWNKDVIKMGELFSKWQDTSFPGKKADAQMDEAVKLLAQNFRGLWT